MTSITFIVPAVPVAQPRQRHRIITSGARTFAQNYTPRDAPVGTFKATVRLAAQHAYKGPPLTGPLRVDVLLVFPRPTNLIWKTRAMPRLRHAKKPDRDNCDKAVMDALKGLLWVDDSQACAGEVQKWIAAGDEQPHVRISVAELL